MIFLDENGEIVDEGQCEQIQRRLSDHQRPYILFWILGDKEEKATSNWRQQLAQRYGQRWVKNIARGQYGTKDWIEGHLILPRDVQEKNEEPIATDICWQIETNWRGFIQQRSGFRPPCSGICRLLSREEATRLHELLCKPQGSDGSYRAGYGL